MYLLYIGNISLNTFPRNIIIIYLQLQLHNLQSGTILSNVWISSLSFFELDEKEIGITKNHLGFIADEIMKVIPPEWEHIVMTDNEGIKKLTYVKLSGIL